jgi:glycosyltransferase involved in cell wall biosynthesis
MRIGIDATCWQNTRGYGRHARGLLSTLVRTDKSNQYVFLLDSEEHARTLPAAAEVRLVRNSLPAAIAASADGHRSIIDMWKMSRAMSAPEFDLLLFPTIYSYVPVFSRAKKVVMIHDVIAETYPDLTVPKRAARLFWNTKVALGRWQADAIVTVSDYSRQGILKHFKTAPERVFVVGEASDPGFCVIEDPEPSPHLRSLGLGGKGRSIVYVGGFGPHKNLQALVGAVARFCHKPQFLDVRLVMVGEYKNEVFYSYFGTIKEQVERASLTERVIFTGYLPDDELVTLLNISTVLVLPSLLEGFGLPAIEAAACGCPVIATHESPLPTLLGNGGIYIDPAKPEDLELALTRVLESAILRQQMRAAGLAAARRLTWDAAAHQMIKVIQQVVMR